MSERFYGSRKRQGPNTRGSNILARSGASRDMGSLEVSTRARSPQSTTASDPLLINLLVDIPAKKKRFTRRHGTSQTRGFGLRLQCAVRAHGFGFSDLMNCAGVSQLLFSIDQLS
jgi:hypothetical protein